MVSEAVTSKVVASKKVNLQAVYKLVELNHQHILSLIPNLRASMKTMVRRDNLLKAVASKRVPVNSAAAVGRPDFAV